MTCTPPDVPNRSSTSRALLRPAPTALALAAVLVSVPPLAGAPDSPFTLANEARERGVRFVQKNFATEMKYPFETLGGAAAAFDYDNDGFVDLLFLNGAPSPEHVRTDPATFNRLYRNTGKGQFEDVTEASGLSGAGIKGYPQGVATGDYDNDGRVDVLVTNFGDNVLYRNEGGGKFVDVTARAGVAMPRHPLKASAAWLDYDNDGWLDLFVTHYFDWTFARQRRRLVRQAREGLPHLLRSRRVQAVAQRPAAQQRRRHLHRRIGEDRPEQVRGQGDGRRHRGLRR